MYLKRLLYLPLLVLCFNNFLFSQDAVIQWENTIGGDLADNPTSIEPTSDGGFILGSYSSSGISADKTDTCRGGNDYWVIKLDANGNIQWQKTIGGTGDDRLYSAKQTLDGGYILAGYSNSGISGEKTESCLGGYDYWVVRLSPTGIVFAQNTLGGAGDDYLYAVWEAATAPNTFILGGSSNSNSSPDKTENCLGGFDYWLLRIDPMMLPIWNNTVGGTGNDYLRDITPKHSDPNFIRAVGYSDSNASPDKLQNSFGGEDYYIVGIDISNGMLTGNGTFGGSGDEQIFSIINTVDNSLILAGYSNSTISGLKTEASHGGYDFWIIKIDELYNIMWQNTIGGTGDDYTIDVVQKNPFEFVVGGAAQSPFSMDMLQDCQAVDYWLVGLNNFSGANIWQNTLAGSYDEFFASMCYRPGSLIMVGASNSNQSFDKSENQIGDYDSWVVRISEQGCINPSWTSVTLADSLICLNEPLTVQVNGSLNSSLFWTITYNNCTPTSAPVVPNASGFSFLPTDTGTFTVYVGPMGVCNPSFSCNPIEFKVKDIPTVSFDILEEYECITSGNILLAGTPTGGVFGGPGVTANIFDPIMAGPGTQYITYTYTDSSGCSASSTDSIIVNDIPVVSFTIPEDSICISSGAITLNANPPGGIYSGTGVIGDQFDPSVAGLGIYNISYDYVDSAGCQAPTTFDNISVVGCLGVDEQNEYVINIYPNPVSDQLYMNTSTENKIHSVEITDITGRKVFSYVINSSNMVINLQQLEQGNYLVKLITDHGEKVKKIIKY